MAFVWRPFLYDLRVRFYLVESISVNTLRNSMYLFKHWGVVNIYVRDGLKLFSLSPAFHAVENVVQKFEEFM